ncbi:DUF1127 domain-containing protein [Antarctobacter sp.]|nr:DUF1127 domain-containing protein [Antarctobacter sp.]
MTLFAKPGNPSPRTARRQLHGMSDHLLRDIGLNPDPTPPRVPHPHLW